MSLLYIDRGIGRRLPDNFRTPPPDFAAGLESVLTDDPAAFQQIGGLAGRTPLRVPPELRCEV